MAEGSLRVVILGATSGIAAATARIYAIEGARLVLVARNTARLRELTAEMLALGASECNWVEQDLAEADPAAVLSRILGPTGGVDHIHVAYAIMPTQVVAAADLAVARSMMETNYVSTALWALAAANLIEAQGHGSLVVLGSVAGDRGRRKNFIYASTKAGIETLVEGIAHRFAGTPMRAIVVKPGPTATAMTAGSPPNRRLAPAESVARIVRSAADRGGPVQYAPRHWWLIMLAVRALPWWLFKRANI